MKDDDLNVARGIVRGLIGGAVLWILILVLLWPLW